VGNIGQDVSSQEQLPSLLSLDQSNLLVWPQIVALVAMTTAMFAGAYVLFLRQEVRAWTSRAITRLDAAEDPIEDAAEDPGGRPPSGMKRGQGPD